MSEEPRYMNAVIPIPGRGAWVAPKAGASAGGGRSGALRGVVACSIALLSITVGACNRPSGVEPPSVRQSLAHGRRDAGEPLAAEAQTRSGPGAAARQEGPAASSRPIACVNGVPIDRRTFIKLLTESRGLPLLQQVVVREVVRQEAERLGLTVTPADIDREYDLTLQAARFNGGEPEKLTPARREQLIEEWTQARGVTRQELAIAMERQAWLRQMAEAKGDVEITEEMLRREFARVHGEKVEVRHIQLPALRVWNQVKQRLERGEDFEDLVADYSQNRISRERRGLLPAFSADDPSVPAILAKVAFSLEPGQVSNPFEVEGSYQVLKLERRIPAEDVALDDVKGQLRGNLLARLVAERMDQLGEHLLLRSRLQIEDQVLRDQYTKRRAAGRLAGPPLSR
ncbi:MAG: peptidyl-prolyl cis-trans isomerase [Phycisphaerae bacterium]|nr:peptidyl-prolyl cis-trans isomerase [Phycisphaerae bacterium]